jgi:hypothetical protein
MLGIRRGGGFWHRLAEICGQFLCLGSVGGVDCATGSGSATPRTSPLLPIPPGERFFGHPCELGSLVAHRRLLRAASPENRVGRATSFTRCDPFSTHAAEQ